MLNVTKIALSLAGMPGCGRYLVRESTQCEEPSLRKSMKFQPGGDTYLTVPSFGMPIAIELDENSSSLGEQLISGD